MGWSDNVDVLVVPGLGGSPEAHWQTAWESLDPTLVRVEQDDWDHPDRQDWVLRLDAAVAARRRPVVLCAHSLGCATVAHAAAQGRLSGVVGAFLVAMPDVERPDFPRVCTGFSPLPRNRLPFPSLVVGSDDDPYIPVGDLSGWAATFGSEFVSVGSRGHIGTAARLGEWREGISLFERFLDGLRGS